MIWSRRLAYITGTVMLRRNPRTVRPAVQQSSGIDGGGRKNARERNYLVKGLPGPDVGKNVTVKASNFNRGQQLSTNGLQ